MKKENLKKIAGNIYTVLLLRILLVYAAYTICRLLFYVFNTGLFTHMHATEGWRIFFGGLRFDTAAILYTNAPVILLHLLPFKFRYDKPYQQAIKILYFIINFLAIAVNMADVVYYRFTLRRTTTTIFSEFQNEHNGIGLFFKFIGDYWYITLSVILLCWLMAIVYRKIKPAFLPLIRNKFIYYLANSLISVLLIIFCIGGMRGGFRHSTRPITLSNASVYVDKPEHRALVLNTPFALLRTLGKTPLEKKNYFSTEQLNRIFDPVIRPDSIRSPYSGQYEGRNVVILIVESFGRELIGSFNRKEGYQGYTPFLDSLSTRSYIFTRGFANGRKSIEALPSTLASLPSMEVPFILSSYSGNKINSIASLLGSEGYYTAFFHGAPNGSMGFDAFARQAGYTRYYGKNEYGNDDDFDGIWGIWDEPFFQYFAREMSRFPQPFIATVFTLSSHHPFNVPDPYKGKFPKGQVPLHQCAGYTDHALKEFFAYVSTQPWYNNTLFILTADHASDNYFPEYKTAHGGFAVPVFFYAPGGNLTGRNDTTVVQQSDILPTVMDLTGYRKPFISFGHNMFDPTAPHFAVNYYNGSYQLIEGNYLLQFTNEQTTGLYDYINDPLLEHNLAGSIPQKQKEMENRLKGILQQYNARMIENELTVN